MATSYRPEVWINCAARNSSIIHYCGHPELCRIELRLFEPKSSIFRKRFETARNQGGNGRKFENRHTN